MKEILNLAMPLPDRKSPVVMTRYNPTGQMQNKHWRSTDSLPHIKQESLAINLESMECEEPQPHWKLSPSCSSWCHHGRFSFSLELQLHAASELAQKHNANTNTHVYFILCTLREGCQWVRMRVCVCVCAHTYCFSSWKYSQNIWTHSNSSSLITEKSSALNHSTNPLP